jgi:glycosyltransferase involved in cell wall biosynthesis
VAPILKLSPGSAMRIAQVAPLYESVPPALYGGTERIVAYLTDELVAEDHNVTLFASGDSRTRARLVPCAPRALRLDPDCVDPLAHHMVMLDEVAKRQDEFDVIHYHVDYLHFPVSRFSHTPRVTTLHGRLDIPDLVPLYRAYADEPLVSISDSQRKPLPDASWVATVKHGLPQRELQPGRGQGGYLAFVGRISPEKRVDRAIEIAGAAGMPLKIAAKIDRADREYFERDVAPLFALPHVDYIGEISEAEKASFLGEAAALLFPIDWEEPFGLVMIEALACGTPVIAFRRGSVPEVIEDGVSGFIVDSIDRAVDAVRRLDRISRDRCRMAFERRFTARRMAHDYVAVYRALITRRNRPLQPERRLARLTRPATAS